MPEEKRSADPVPLDDGGQQTAVTEVPVKPEDVAIVSLPVPVLESPIEPEVPVAKLPAGVPAFAQSHFERILAVTNYESSQLNDRQLRMLGALLTNIGSLVSSGEMQTLLGIGQEACRAVQDSLAVGLFANTGFTMFFEEKKAMRFWGRSQKPKVRPERRSQHMSRIHAGARWHTCASDAVA